MDAWRSFSPAQKSSGSTTALFAAAINAPDEDPRYQADDQGTAQDRFAVAEELLERGFPISFGGGGPSLLLCAMLDADVQMVSLLLKYGDGREFEGEIGGHLLDNARGYASGTGPFAGNRITPAARLVMAAVATCHPGKVRRAMQRLRRLAPRIGRMRVFFMALYTDVHYRPGGEGEQAAKASFEACRVAG